MSVPLPFRPRRWRSTAELGRANHVLDYLVSEQKRLLKIFNWEDDYFQKPTRPLIKFACNLPRIGSIYHASTKLERWGQQRAYNLLLDNTPTPSESRRTTSNSTVSATFPFGGSSS